MHDDPSGEARRVPSAEDATSALISDLAGFRSRRRQTPLLRYENLEMSPRHLDSGFRELIERRLRHGYERDGSSIPSVVGPIEWSSPNRSFALRLHGWDPISELLMGHSIDRDERYFAAALGFADDWIAHVQIPSFAIGPAPAKLNAAFGPMPWYDMAVGRRAYRLAYILDVMVRDSRFADEHVVGVLGTLVFHLQLLGREDFFRSEHNHGFYQAFGELAAARRFRDEPFFAERFAMATRRVRGAIDQQFHAGGIHREHSPGYHHMVLGSLIGARESGLIASRDVRERVASCEEAMTWLIQPNGALLTFGDTDPQNMLKGEFYPDRFENRTLRYQLSRGALGERPRRGLLCLKDEGYVFARSDAPERPGDPWWYLAQTASFSSRVHKHADDLSFVWSDGGTEILIDPGRFAYGAKTEPGSDLARQGFWYADPKRIYVESTRAHNTVEIDGRSYDRTSKPYGSALRYAGEQAGLIVTECELRHVRTVRHRRVLVMAPGRFLLVVDRLLDRSGQRHDFRQHFHVHPAWTVAPDSADAAGRRVLAVHGVSEQRLVVLPLIADQTPIRTVRGQEEPDLLGWFSDGPRSLVPCATLVSDRLGADHAVFATLFTFATDARPVSTQIFARSWTRPSTFAWEGVDGLTRIELRHGDEDDAVLVTMRGD